MATWLFAWQNGVFAIFLFEVVCLVACLFGAMYEWGDELFSSQMIEDTAKSLSGQLFVLALAVGFLPIVVVCMIGFMIILPVFILRLIWEVITGLVSDLI